VVHLSQLDDASGCKRLDGARGCKRLSDFYVQSHL